MFTWLKRLFHHEVTVTPSVTLAPVECPDEVPAPGVLLECPDVIPTVVVTDDSLITSDKIEVRGMGLWGPPLSEESRGFLTDQLWLAFKILQDRKARGEPHRREAGVVYLSHYTQVSLVKPPTDRFLLGQLVTWESQAGGHTTTKLGIVVAVVGPGSLPAPPVRAVFPNDRLDFSLKPLKGQSYVVWAVGSTDKPGSKPRFYRPLTKYLKPYWS